MSGLIASFDTPRALKNAAGRLRENGFCALEAFSPAPVEGLADILHPRRRGKNLPLLMFAGAVLGAVFGYLLQYWAEAIDYPINVGGRPFNSWPAFAVSTFEFSVLFAVGFGLVGLLAASGLPRLYDKIDETESLARASRDRFLILVKASDPRFDAKAVRLLLGQLGAQRIEEAPK